MLPAASMPLLCDEYATCRKRGSVGGVPPVLALWSGAMGGNELFVAAKKEAKDVGTDDDDAVE